VNWLWFIAGIFVVAGSILAIAESSLTRMTRVRALALLEEGRRNAGVLERIEADPPRYLNSIYLCVMVVQNGSAVLVAILAENNFAGRDLAGIGITVVSFAFTILYFVFVEAMSKTFGILHSDRMALALAPLVWFLGRVLAAPTRLLIGIANVLLPGKGIKQGPWVSEEEIRSMAQVGSEEGSIEEDERDLIHSIFEFSDTIVREVMVPRPDIVAVEDTQPLRDVQALVLTHGYSRVPVYHEDLETIVGVCYAKDVLKAIHQGKQDSPLTEVVREAHYVPETKKVAELLREMQKEKFHIAIVTDEYGSVSGLVTLEDLLEELVGEIADEYDQEEPEIAEVEPGVYRVSGKASIDDVNELLETELPDEGWDTVAGFVLDLFGKIPSEGEEQAYQGLAFRAEEVQGRRIAKVLITRTPSPEPLAQPAEAEIASE
jgi:CBS domain containing-hemolysin-like protein